MKPRRTYLRLAQASAGLACTWMIALQPAAQHRMQTHGTFKLVFNAIVGARLEGGDIAEGGGL